MKLRVLALAAAAIATAAVALAGPASAHVTVNSPGAAQGGYAVLTFRVPTESSTASTTRLQVQFPTTTPIASVLVQPHPGWSFVTKTSKLSTPIKTDDGDSITEAVSEIDWKADSTADAIKPGEFDQFLVSAGPLPNVATLQFGAIQTYSDGSVVNWNEVAAPGSTAEPEHPKPSLTLVKAGATDAPQAATSSKSSSDTGAIVLSVIALVLAAGAVGVAFVTRAKRGDDLMRIPWATLVAGVAVAVIGGAGLIRGAMPVGVATGGGTSGSAPIVVTGAYVREPAPPTDAAAAYFTVYNTTGTADRLITVVTGAGRTSTLHTLVNGEMVATANGALIPPHGSLVLSTGTGHVMIEQLFGPLKPGQSVNLALTFVDAGTVNVSAPVIALGAPAPTGSTSGTPSSGATK